MPQHPVHVMYRDLHEQDAAPKRIKATWEPGKCSVCGLEAETMRAGALLGKGFGSWQEVIKHPGITLVCKACGWAAKDARLLRSPVLIEDHASFISWNDLAQRLMKAPQIDSRTALVAPAGGRKIVAPHACYGRLATDSMVIEWTRHLQAALIVCARLRASGQGGRMLVNDRLAIDADCPERKVRAMHEMWDFLGFVRGDKNLRVLYSKMTMNLPGADEPNEGREGGEG